MEITMEEYQEIPVISLLGKLDTVTSPDLQEKLMEVIGEGNHKIIINFSGVDYVSSAGLRVLLMGLKRVKPNGGSIILASVQDSIKDILA